MLGTFVTITLYSADRTQAFEIIELAFQEFEKADALLSNHRADSALSRLNEGAGQEWTRIPNELFGVLRQVLDLSIRTGGAFDPTIGPLSQLWGFIWKEYRMPTPRELESVLPRIDHAKVQLDHSKVAVRFGIPGQSVDSGGFGKGYAVDRAIERLKELGIDRAMVKAGGDLRVLGLPPGASHWTVQIEDPSGRGNRVNIPLRSGALSTSGSYENFFEVDGVRYSHILNPDTGLPVRGMAACTVLAPTCLQSDILATAFFIMGPEETGRRFEGQFPFRFVLMETATGEWPEIVSANFPNPLP